MHLSKEELELIYNHIPNGALKDKIAAQIFVNDSIVKDIINTFPDAASIWKCCDSSKYYAKFYDKNDDTPFRIALCIQLQNKYNHDIEIDVLELSIKDKGTKNDWMYSQCDLIWENPNQDAN